MSDAYHQLLEATIEHLEDLKTHGTRFVAVSPQALAGLAVRQPLAPAKKQQVPPPPARRSIEKPVSKSAPAQQKVTAVMRTTETELALPSMGPTGAAPQAAELSPEAKTAAFAELSQRAAVCVKCSHLAASRKNVVFGVGDIGARLMFVGEAPGADEDEQGEPFVGKAGELLTRIIQTMGLSRPSVYIANILKCRPDTPGQASGNRKPTREEMNTCIPFLQEQIDLIRPQALVALGATAVEGLLGKPVFITKLRGQWQTYRGIPLMPTYHPAYLLRNQAPTEKRRLWEDMLQVMEKLGMTITERQRGFFLKG
jgi:uracil-DNA glycosylase family 4